MNDDPSTRPPVQPEQPTNPNPSFDLEREPATVGQAPGETVTPVNNNQASTPIVSTQPQATPPPRKAKKPFLLVAVLAAIVLLLGGAGAAYAYWYQNPERVVGEAMLKLLSAEDVRTETVITSESNIGSGMANVKVKKFEVLGAANGTTATGETDVNLTIEFNGRDYTVGAKGKITDGLTLYFQIVNVKELVTKLADDFGEGQIEITDDMNRQFDAIQNKWVKVTTEDMGEQAESFKCYLDTTKRIATEEQYVEEAKQLYEKNKFFVVGDKVQSKDGNLGYKVELNTDALKTYIRESESTKAAEEYKKCPGYEETSAQGASLPDEAINSESADIDIVVWVSRFGHELQQVDYTLTAKIPQAENVVFKGETKLHYDAVTIEAPAESVELKTWMGEIEKIQPLGTPTLEREQSVAANGAASMIRTKAEAYNAIMGKYPSYNELLQGNPQAPEAKLDAALQQKLQQTPPNAQQTDKVQYQVCGNGTGAIVAYYDTVKKAVETRTLGIGCNAGNSA